jgi:arginase
MTVRPLAILDAPSNLGLHPPEEGSVPGCYKAPGVLRDLGLLDRLGAEDVGVLTAARYRAEWKPGSVRNEAAIADYSRGLADRLAGLLDSRTPVVLGGDCSILVGVGLALHRRGRFGLVSFDGLDYRHPGTSEVVGAAGGESLAMVTGLGGLLAELDGARPYLRPEDVVAIGLRTNDESAAEAAADGLHLIDAPTAGADTAGAAARALEVVDRPELAGFWVHFDADVIDAALMPAVDSPEPGGLTFEQLVEILAPLVSSPRFVGLDLTIYDPDLDPGFEGGRKLADALVKALKG